MKRFLFFCLATLFAVTSWAQSYNYDFYAENSDGVIIYYTILDESAKTVEVANENRSIASTYTGVVNIPETASYEDETFDVVGIGNNAFLECSVTSVTIPSSVTSIGNYAFEYCTGLTEIEIPNSVTSIGNSVFTRCTNLVKVTLPEGLESISDYMFSYCSSLASIDIPSSVTSIGESAFQTCVSLTSIDLPNSITSIGSDAFDYCSSLEEITIPSGVTVISSGMLADCESLKKVVLPEGITEIQDNAFEADEVLEDINLPSTLTTIGGWVFQDCYDGLAEITIPANVTSIGQGAFDGCESLKTINYNAKACEAAGDSTFPAFGGCTSVSTVNIGDEVTIIPAYLCKGFKSLTSITLPESVVSIGAGVFATNGRTACGLEEITSLPTTPPTCADDSFTDDIVSWGTLNVPCASQDAYTSVEPWKNFETIVGIDCVDETVTFEVDGIYYQTTSSKEVEVTASGGSAYSGNIDVPSDVVYNGDTYTVIGIGEQAFVDCTKLTGISLPSTLKYIGDYAFSFDSDATPSLTEIVIPESCTSIGEYAFQYCSSLASVTLPSGLTEIATGTFYYCALTTIEIPASVTSLGVNAFRNCKSLTSVTCLAVEPPTCVRSANGVQTPFYNVTISDLPLYVPSGSEDAYKAADVWQDFGTIEAIGGSSEGTPLEDGATFEYDGLNYKVVSSADLNVEVTGSGSTPCTYSGDIDIPESVTYDNVTYHVVGIGDSAFYVGTSVTGLTIAESVTYIGAYAFYNCSQVKSIDVPSSVTSIGQYAFQMCSGVTSMSITGVDAIADGLFYSCSALESVELPTSVSSMGKEVFRGCSKLSSVTLPDGFTTLGSYSFYSCSALTNITIPASVTTIDTYAFQSSGLVNISFAKDSELTTIGNYAFYGTKLEAIELPAEVTTIGNNAFYNCTSLASVVIPDKVTKLGQSAFQGCSALEEVTLGESVSDMSSDGIFYGCSKLLSVTSLNPEPPTCASTVFASATTSDGILYVPCDSKDLYADASTWKNFANIEGIDCEDEGGSGIDNFVNGGFEEWTDLSSPVGWTGNLGSNATLTQSTDAHGGNYAVNVAHKSSNQRLASKDYTLEAGTYDVCFYVKSADANALGKVRGGYVIVTDGAIADSNDYIYVTSATEIPAEWTEHTFSFTLDSETTVEFIVMNQNGGAGDLLVDDYTVKVAETASGHGYEADDPFTPSEAIELAETLDSSTTISGVYVKGIISQIDEISTSYGNATYYISEDGTTTDQFEIYRGYYLDGEKFTSEDQIEVSDIVLVTGDLVNYNGKTPELTSGNKIVSIEKAEGGGEHEYSIDPVEGVQTSLQNFTFTSYDGICGNDQWYAEYNGTVSIYKDGSTEPYATTTEIEGDWDSNVSFDYDVYLYINFENKITEAGEYELVIPAGLFNWFNDDNPTLNEEIRFSYTVDGSEDTGSDEHEYSIDPEEGVQTSLQNFTFTSYDGICGNDEWYAEYNGTVSIYKDGSTEPYATTTEIEGDWDSNVSFDYDVYLYINFENKITEAGEYELVIPAGLFNWFNDDNPTLNEEIRFSYTVDGSEDVSYELVVDPESGETLESLSEFTITCEEGLGLNLWDALEVKKDDVVVAEGWYDITVRDNDGNSLGYTFILYEPNSENTITLTDAGTYTIDVPDEYFVFDNESLSEGFTITYYIEEAVSFSDYYTLDPEEGVVESLSSVKFTPLEDAKIAWSEKVDVDQVKVYKDGDTTTAVAYGASVDHPYSGSYDEYDEIFFNVTLTDPGEYEVVFPYNSFVYNNNGRTSCEEFSLHYTIEDNFSGWGVPSGYIVDPDDESYVETLKTINISYDGAGLTCADAVYAGTTGVVMSKTGGQVATVSFEDGWDDDLDLAYVIATLSEEISEIGTYYVTFPEAVFMHWDNYGTNPEFTVTYYVTGPTSSAEYTYDPEDGSTLGHLSEFTVYYSDGIDCSWNYSGEITVTDEDGNVVANDDDCETEYPADDPWGDGLYCTITLNATITAAGKYTVNIPEGYFVVGSNYLNSEALTITYYVDGSEAVEPGTFVCVVDPEDKSSLEQLAQVAFYNPTEDEEIFVNDELARDPEIYVYNEAGDVVTTISYFDTLFGNNGEEYTQIVVFEDVVTDGGTYTVSVPAEMFIIYDEDNRPYYSEAMTLTYTIVGTGTGIGGISINDENVEGIYSTSGQKLNSTVKGVNIIRYSDGSVKKIYVK